MEIKSVKMYTSNNAVRHLASPSGVYFDENGNQVSEKNIQTKKKLFDRVASGELGTTTKVGYAIRSINYTGSDDPKEPKKHPDNQINFEHIVIENIPSNADSESIQKIVLNQYKNVDFFYVDDKGTPQIFLGEREVHSRIDQKPDGSKHIHFFINRMGIVSRDRLEEKLKEMTEVGKTFDEPETALKHISTLKSALVNSGGKKFILEQSLDLNNNYVQKHIAKSINEELIKNGIAPVGDWGSYSQNDTSNVKTTTEAKKAIVEVEKQGYTEEAVSNLVSNIEAEQFSNLDSVILQKKLSSNKDTMNRLAEEMRRLTAESRQLEEAQKAILTVEQLSYDNKKLNDTVETLNNEISKVVEEKEVLEEKLNVVASEVLEVRNTFELPPEMPIVAGISDKLQEKEDDYQAVIEEKIELEKVFKTELQNKTEEIAEKEIFIEALTEENQSLQNVKTENGLLKSTIEQKDSVIATKDTQIEIEKKYRSDTELKYSQLEERFNQVLENSKAQEEANRKLLEQNTRMLESLEQLQQENKKLEAEVKKSYSQNLEFDKVNEGLRKDIKAKDLQIEGLTSELATKDKAINVLTELYTEVKNRLASTTARLKASLTKLSNGEVKNSITKVVKDNNSFAQQLKAIDEDTEDKTQKIEALRQRIKDQANADKAEDNKEKDNLKVNKPK